MKKNHRRYTELKQLKTFDERFEYLRLKGDVGKDTFGHDRYLNQNFYKSEEWKRIRDYVIVRDEGCDMGLSPYKIEGRIYIHHLDPITKDDVLAHSDVLLDPDNLVCVSFETHNAIHYGSDRSLNTYDVVERQINDTCPWR